MDDRQIIELYFARSERAIEETDTKYGPYCRTIAFNVLSDPQDTEECVNDTYLQTWNTIPPTIPEQLKAFVGRITRNLSLNRLKAKNAAKRKSEQYALAYEELQDLLASEQSVEETINELWLKELINGFLAQLPQESRWAFVGRYWYFDSISQIAKKLKISESKAKMLLLRTRNAMKEYLRKEGVAL